MRRRVALALAVSLAGVLPARGSGHDFEESRRIVLALAGEEVELLVAYELRPGRLADGLRARYDAGDDGQIASGWERLARSRVMAPRIAESLALEADGQRLPLRLVELAFPDAPHEGGRRGVAAVALFEAELPPGTRALSVRSERGHATLEAQAAPPLRVWSEDLPARPADPVLGPSIVRPGRALTLRLR